MAAGDTISGSVRVLKEDTEGNRTIVFGPERSSAVDGKNGSLGVEEKLYINTMFDNGVSAPLQSKEKKMVNSNGNPVTWFPGEKIVVQHLSSGTEEASDSDAADAFAMEIIKRDLNTNRRYPTVLDEADNEISSNPSTSSSSYVDIFEETIPDRQQYRFAGSFEAGAYENA